MRTLVFPPMESMEFHAIQNFVRNAVKSGHIWELNDSADHSNQFST